jgi:hypothetical protein
MPNRDERRARQLAEKVFAGPGFIDVPDPSMPLSDFEQRKYFELCGRLVAQGKLTAATRDGVEQIAILYGAQYQRLSCGQRVPAYITRDIARLTANLRLVEDLTPIGGNVGLKPKENPFDLCGALLAPFAPGRLRAPAAATA